MPIPAKPKQNLTVQSGASNPSIPSLRCNAFQSIPPLQAYLTACSRQQPSPVFSRGDFHVNNKLLVGVPKTLESNGGSEKSIKGGKASLPHTTHT